MLTSFCGILTLQVGTAILAAVFLTVAVLVLAENLFNYYSDPTLSFPLPLVLVIIFVILIALAGIVMFMAAYNESRLQCIISVALLVIAMTYWIILACFSFANNAKQIRSVCVLDRCGETFWLVSLEYRGNWRGINTITSGNSETTPKSTEGILVGNEDSKTAGDDSGSDKEDDHREKDEKDDDLKEEHKDDVTEEGNKDDDSEKSTTSTSGSTSISTTTTEGPTDEPRAIQSRKRSLQRSGHNEHTQVELDEQAFFPLHLTNDIATESFNLNNTKPHNILKRQDNFDEAAVSSDDKEDLEEVEENNPDGETKYDFGLPMVGAIVMFVLNFVFFLFSILIMWSYAQELKWADYYDDEEN